MSESKAPRGKARNQTEDQVPSAPSGSEDIIDDLLPNGVFSESGSSVSESANAAAGATHDEAVSREPEGVEAVLAAVTAERDGYLDALQRLKAEFDNHRRRTTEQAGQQRQQAAAGLVEKLLPILDSCDAALAHDAEAVRPILEALTGVLTSAGLERIAPLEEPFDPERHDAVMHEEGDDENPMVTEVLRSGYAWNGRVLRPAMVKVRG